MRFSVLEIFLIAVPILETLRIIILCRDMRKLALVKGERPQKWMWYTALLWISVEGTVIGLWFFFMGFRYLIAGIIVAILLARVCFAFLKQRLENIDEQAWDEKIEEIGRE